MFVVEIDKTLMNLNLTSHKASLFQLPTDLDLTLFLIQKQLEATRFLSDLQQVGLNKDIDCFDLGDAILSLMGYEDTTDELWENYYNTLNNFADKLAMDEKCTSKHLALEFYGQMKVNGYDSVESSGRR